MKTLKSYSGASGFTLIKLLVTIAIIGILVAILLPTLSRSKDKAKSAACLNNMHQIGVASQMYTDDNADVIIPMARLVTPYPNNLIVPYKPYVWWPDTLRPYTQSGAKLYTCPSAPEVQGGVHLTNALGIGMNFNELGVFPENVDPKTGKFVKFTMIRNPSATVVFGDVAFVRNFTEKNADLWVANLDRVNPWEGFGFWLLGLGEGRSLPKT